MSESSGRDSASREAGSQEVSPKAREPMYMFSVARICTTSRWPRSRGPGGGSYNYWKKEGVRKN